MPAAAPRGNGPAPGRSFRQGDEGPRSSGLRCIPMRHAVGCAAHRSGSDAMRKIMLLAAIVAALGMAPQSAEARDRGFSLRHFSGARWPEAAPATLGLKFHHGGFFGKPRPFKPPRFGHFGHRGLHSSSDMSRTSSRDASVTLARADSCSSLATATSCSSSAICRISSITTSATGTVITGWPQIRSVTALQSVARPRLCLQGWDGRPGHFRQSMPGSQVGQSGRVTPRCAARSPPQSARADRLSARARASAQPRSLKNGAASAAPAALREVADVNIQGPIDPS